MVKLREKSVESVVERKVSALLAITTSGIPFTTPVQVLPWLQPRRAELYYLGPMPGQQMSSCPIGPVGRTLLGM